MESAFKSRLGKSVATVVIILFSLVTVLAFAPSNSSAFFHKPKTAAKTSQVRPTPSPTPTPRASSQTQKSVKPSFAATFLQSLGRSLAAVGDFLWPFEDLKRPENKTENKAVAKANVPKGEVKGASDSKESGIGNFFKNIWGGIAAVLDFLWPFEDWGKSDKNKTGLAQTNNPTETPSPLPKASPNTLAQTGETSVEVVDPGVSTQVVVTDTVEDLTVTNELTVNGKTTLGDTSADRIFLKGLLGSDVLVDTTKSYNIGSGGGRFKAGYFSDNIYIGEENRLGADGMNVKGSMYLNTRSGGSIYLDSDSGTVYLGEGTNKLSNADNAALTIDPNGSNQINFHSSSNFIDSSGNMTIVGTLTQTGSGGSSSDSVDITPATNIDALDIIGTNITTADLIDLDATATTTGDAIDINMANTRTSGSAILIADESVAATVTGDLIQINVTGTPDTNTLDIDVSAAASGNMIDLTSTDVVYTGNMIDINAGNAAQTGDAINISMGAGAVGFQGLVMSTSAGIRTASAIALTENNTTGTVPTIQYDSAQTRGGVMDINLTGILATENAINIDASAAFTSNLLNFNTTAASSGNVIGVTTATAASSGNLIDLNFGNIADTGDAVNISMGAAAVGAQGLVMTTSAGIRTASAIDITENNTTGTVASIAYTSAQTRGGIMDLNLTGALGTENAIDIDTTAAFTSNLVDITTATSASSGNLIDLNFGNIADTGDAINISMGAAAVGAQGLVMSTSAGIRTASAIALTENNTTGTVPTIQYDSAQTRGGFLDLNATGILATENLITIDMSAAFTSNVIDVNTTAASSGNVIDITTATAASSGNLIDLNFGNIADTGDAINISMGAAAVGAQGLVMSTSAGIRTASAIALTENNTTGTVPTIQYDSAQTRGGVMDINLTGALGTENAIDIDTTAAFTSNLIDITTATAASSGNLIDLNFGAVADTGDAINIAMGATAVNAQALVITNAAGIRTANMIQVDDNNSTGTVATFDLNIASTRGGLFDIDTSGAFGTENLIDITTGAQAWTSNILDINVGAAAATGDVINIALGASAPAAQALVVTGSSSTATGGVVSLAVDTAAAQSADIVDITSTLGIMDGSDTFQGIDVNITGANHTGASNVINGIAVDLTTADADAAEIGVNVGDNWDLGISSTSGIGIGAQKTLTANSTTPSVAGTSHAITANVTNPTLISNFTSGTNGQVLVVELGDAVTDFDCTASNIACGGADITTGATGDIFTFVYDGTNWNMVQWMDVSATQTGADLAEYFGSTETLEPGDVVSADVTNPEYVRKSAGAYDSRLLGVVSTLPGLVIGDPNDINQIALIGRVPVKVTNENGAIKAGDYLTSSGSKAGYAMRSTKPGPVVGMALADFAGEEGTVVVFVKAAWFDPVEEQKRAVLAALGVGSASVLGATTSTVTPTLTSDEVTTPTAATNPLVGPAPDGSLGVLAEEVDLLVHGLLTANNLRVTTAAEFTGTLVVKGLATFEGDLVVKGAFSTGSLDLSGALTKTMTAGSDLSAGDPVVVTGANTVARAGGPGANVVGLAASDAGAGSSVRVAVAGTVGGYSGLSIGSRYYVGSGGTVTTAPGGDRAVHIGIAVSSSEMIVQIFESAAPPAPPVVDTATVDSGPTVTVSEGSTGSLDSTTPSASPTPEPSPSPTSAEATVAEPSPLPLSPPSSGQAGQAEPAVESSLAPSVEPSPSPQP